MTHYIIEKAEEKDLIKTGNTIVEATSGNTGNVMSMIAATKGYKMIVMIPSGYSSERVQISRGYSAEIQFVGDFQINEALKASAELGKREGYFCPAQFNNEWNVEENPELLGQEILRDLPNGVKIDAIVQGVETVGTLIGVAQKLREDHNPELKSFAMEPTVSRSLECCIVAKHKIEDISDGFVPTIYDRYRSEIDEIIHVKSDAAIEKSLRLGLEKALFVGPSSCANYWAARYIKDKYPAIKTVLTFLCDRAKK